MSPLILKMDWDEMIDEDSIGEKKFRTFPEYDGTGKYRFKFVFGLKKKAPRRFVSISPEFQVIEPGFKKNK